MKLLTSRADGIRASIVTDGMVSGQWLTYDDGSTEWDAGYKQTTPILTAERYNGKAAKDDEGNWVPAPGPRVHDWGTQIWDFKVGLTFERIDSDGKSVFDYSLTTPTGVSFHGDGKGNVLCVPGDYSLERVAVEVAWWMCLGEEDSEMPEDTTPEQWEWIRSEERVLSAIDIDDLMQEMDKGFTLEEAARNLKFDSPGNIAPEPEDKEALIQERAKLYFDTMVYYRQNSLVEYLLEKGDHVSFEDIINLTPDTANMDATALAEFLSDEMGVDWKDLIDIQDYVTTDDDAEEAPDLDAERANLNVRDLQEWDLELLRDHITENHEPREIFQWWLVDEWLAKELAAIGHPTLTDDESHWWGRRTAGQALLDDGTLQQIAKKYV